MMKSHVRPGLRVTEFGPSDGSCCQMSSAPPAEKKIGFTNQGQRRLQTNQLESAVMKFYPPSLHRPSYPETAPPLGSSSHQVRLCTFLI